MTSVAELSASARESGTVHLPPTWLQGRTAYGGVSSAIAYAAASKAAEDLPPLRSAQVNFIGPLAGDAKVETRVLRQGRNAAFIEADILSDDKLAVRTLFIFMRPLPSSAALAIGGAGDFSDPDDATPITFNPSTPSFIGNFDLAHALPVGTEGPADFMRWVRLKERDGLDPMTEIMAIGDCLPPAAMRLMEKPAPVSSLNWTVNLVTPKVETRDGWWLLRSTALHAEDGCSSQVMRVWNRDGALVAEAMQSVALFG